MPPITPVSPPVQQAKPGGCVAPASAKLHKAAKDFEAMFMTEMMHQARPSPQAGGVFAAGIGEKSWQVFMDQALGKAAASQSGTGLTREIEKALRAAQGQCSKGVNK
jgi:Rod binding domain-containing protein